MGGGSNCSSPSTEDVSQSSQGFPHDSILSSRDDECLSHKLVNSAIEEAAERQRLKVYTQVLRSYEDLQPKIDRLDEAKSRILNLRYNTFDFRESDAPNPTSLLVVGPKGSGKSSLINKLSRVFEYDVFQPARAQVSCNSSPEDGTYFIHEYSIPRNCASFSFYDTRGLSDDTSENLKMIKSWMTKGVRDGELVIRESDSKTLKDRLKCMDRESSSSGQANSIDFVIFVVNGLSVLESMNSDDETKKGYSRIINTAFKNPWLSFKDNMPAIVVTHGDLLSLSDRVRVRVYLGELLGVPPTDQIFDIPENDDPATTSAIFDLLFYCLDRADQCLPFIDDMFTYKVKAVTKLLIVIIAAIFMFWMVACLHPGRPGAPAEDSLQHGQPQAPLFKVDWHKIRHLWLEE